MHQGITKCPQCGEDESNKHLILCKHPQSAYNKRLRISAMASKIKQIKIGTKRTITGMFVVLITPFIAANKEPGGTTAS